MNDHADVIIVGGGMVGLALACALRHTGLRIVIIERGEPPVRLSLGRDCRVSAIVMGNVRILEGLGVWKHLKDDAGPMRTMKIWDNQEQGGIRFDASEIEEEALGYLIENSCTQRPCIKHCWTVMMWSFIHRLKSALSIGMAMMASRRP